MNVVIDNKQYLVGTAAETSTIERISTDINSHRGKARMSMSKIVPLSTIAAYANLIGLEVLAHAMVTKYK